MNSLVLQALLGIVVLFGSCWFFSEARRHVKIKTILTGLILQVGLALLLLNFAPAREIFTFVAKGVGALKNATLAGTSFAFGYIGGGPAPFDVTNPAALFSLTFQTLPMLIVISALAMLMFHWKVLPLIVRGVSFVLRKSMGIGGALGVCAGAKVFLGQTDAPLLIRPYLRNLSRSELFTVMTLGMATTSGTIIVLYATLLSPVLPHALVHIMTCSLISVPAALTISRMLIPASEKATEGELVVPYNFSSSTDAISRGTADGLRLFASIIGMLIVFVTLVALVNKIIGLALPSYGGQPLSLQGILGYFMAPITWLMGVPWSEALTAGELLGTKAILNEIYAFLDLSKVQTENFSIHSRLIMTYALCGFANLSSIGIQIGGLGTLVPERREEIISLGFKALIAGTLSSCLSGTIVGLLYWIEPALHQ